ncbi:T9SS type A sorting domain-containing protein [uncultured Tenacibaculum sp.]|uniref:T9SS type A sorting domain-containing protein n=1 Tax=uncultured Tenacibaculum sp. TaxID=174713 RepID=UPI002623E271|nr:T9SS type A sorting domain-containing protein [uncultured Tenacibaculum sp.]
MKKNYFLTLLLSFVTYLSFGQIIITELADPNNNAAARYVEIYNAGTTGVDLTDWYLLRWTNANTTPQGSNISLTPIGTLNPGAFAIIAANATEFQTVYGIAADIEGGTSGAADSNGDDQIAIFDNTDTLIDIFGIPGEDGSGTCHEFEDGRAERQANVKTAKTTWSEADWNVWADSAVSGCTNHINATQDAPASFDPGAWIGTTTAPSLTISSPSNGSTISFTDMATVKFSVNNFNVAAGGSGDGYIKWTLNSVAQADKFDTDDITFATTGGTTYEVYMELVDNAGNALSTPVNQTISFIVDLTCDIQIGTISTTCNAETSGVDTYNVSLDFTGGGTSTYTLTADNGTVGGDNPSMMTSGTITITGVTEGTNIVFTVKGDASNSSCDFTRNISSPTCKALPFIETFDYTDAAVLSDQANWEIISSSSDDILVSSGSLDYTGLKVSEGNKITFDGVGSDIATRFTDVSSGTIYTSFLFKVTAFQTGSSPDTTDGGYFATFASNNSFQTRVWVRPNPDTSGTTFDIGYGSESSNPPFTTSTYNLGDVLFIVIANDLDNDVVSLWVNPDAATFEGAAPTPDLGGNDANSPSSINTFILRQDSTNETPTIEIDELRIAKTWAEVTPKDTTTASVIENEIDGFAAYPNPINGKSLTITSSSIDNKKVQIFNMIGKEVYQTSISGTNNRIDVSGVSSGMYILKVVEANKTATQKLIIK